MIMLLVFTGTFLLAGFIIFILLIKKKPAKKSKETADKDETKTVIKKSWVILAILAVSAVAVASVFMFTDLWSSVTAWDWSTTYVGEQIDKEFEGGSKWLWLVVPAFLLFMVKMFMSFWPGNKSKGKVVGGITSLFDAIISTCFELIVWSLVLAAALLIAYAVWSTVQWNENRMVENTSRSAGNCIYVGDQKGHELVLRKGSKCNYVRMDSRQFNKFATNYHQKVIVQFQPGTVGAQSGWNAEEFFFKPVKNGPTGYRFKPNPATFKSYGIKGSDFMFTTVNK